MKKLMLLVVLALVAAACGASGDDTTTTAAAAAPTTTAAEETTTTAADETTTTAAAEITTTAAAGEGAVFAVTEVVFGDQGYVAITNIGGETGNLERWQLCQRPAYFGMPSQELASGETVYVTATTVVGLDVDGPVIDAGGRFGSLSASGRRNWPVPRLQLRQHELNRQLRRVGEQRSCPFGRRGRGGDLGRRRFRRCRGCRPDRGNGRAAARRRRLGDRLGGCCAILQRVVAVRRNRVTATLEQAAAHSTCHCSAPS